MQSQAVIENLTTYFFMPDMVKPINNRQVKQFKEVLECRLRKPYPSNKMPVIEVKRNRRNDSNKIRVRLGS